MIHKIDMNDDECAIVITKNGKFYAKKCSVKKDFAQNFYVLCAATMRFLRIDFKIDVTTWDNDSKKCGFRIIEK